MAIGMRKAGLGLILAVGIAFLLVAAAPALAAGGFAQIENVQAPSVRPGDTFTVGFDVHNVLNDKVRYVYATAQASSSFMPVGGDTWASAGEIGADGREDASLTFKSDDNLVSGVYSIPILLTSEAKTLSGMSMSGGLVNSLQTLTTTNYVYVRVEGSPSLVVSQKSSAPALIEAGQPATITFDLFNNGTDFARNVRVETAEPADVDLSSASGSVFVGEIAPKARASFQIGLVADKVPGRTSFILPMEVSYDGSAFSLASPVLLRKTAELSILSVEGELQRGKNGQNLAVVLKNVGSHDAENIRATLLTDYPVTPSGRDAFVQELPAGGTARALFTVDVDSKGAIQGYPIQVAVTYDERAESRSDLLESGVKVVEGPNSFYLWAGGVILALFAVGFIRIKMRKGSRNKK